jgi:curli biogenesis system outer membrane secretion channel CsgG
MSRYFVMGVSLMALLLTACSNIKVATIPPPHPTAKLRIYVQAVSTQQSTKVRWDISPEKFSDNQVRLIENILKKSGIYEVVSDDDVNAVLGEQQPARWEFERGNWALARHIAAALHADYALIVERGISSLEYAFFEVVLINAATGKRFGVSLQFFNLQKGEGRRPKGIVPAAYRELFRDAKADLLGMAIRKSRLSVLEPAVTAQAPLLDYTKEQIPSLDKKPESPAIAESTKEREVALREKERAERERLEQEKARALREKERAEKERAEQEKVLALRERERIKDDTKKKPSASDQIAPAPILAKTIPAATTEGGSRIIDIESMFVEDAPAGTGERLVVYDLEASENLRPMSLILSESLREELFKFRRFSLVNRENMLQLMDELKFQQTGLVDEKQAVQLGKGMAANQVVTGRFGPLGGSYILQAKRIDVQSLGTRALGSLKCRQGEEEQLLEQLPALAKKLAEAP